MTFEEFVEHYEKYGRCKGDAFKNKNKLNEKQLKTKYKNYMRKFNNDGLTLDQVLRGVILKRDIGCRLICKLTDEEKLLLTDDFMLDILDVAHVFGKSAFPHMRYMADNVVLLNRVFHSRLDIGKNPLTGKSMSKEEHEQWWIRIVGKNKFEELKEIAKNVK